MKTALIVDDSRLARAVLRKTLVEYGIAVDEVASAEAAIEYLKVDHPDIIFLDHLMPGMDGFETLGVLKKDPITAMIPVMMYTSQEGQFYVSQARALGAVDVLPKNLAPADVERVLRSHHLIDDPSWTLVEGEQRSNSDQHELMERVRMMLDEQAVMLMSDFRRELDRAQSESAAHVRELVEQSAASSRAASHARVALAASLVTLTIATLIGVDHFSSDGGSRGDASSAELQATILGPVDVEPASASPELESLESDSRLVADVAATNWNITQSYAYDAIPLNDDRAREYAPIFDELKRDGFAGRVTLEIHEGRYCINYAPDGSPNLAPPDQLAVSCDYIGTLHSGSGGALQSPMFASMVDSASRDGRLRIETLGRGTTQPMIEYPDYSVTAGFWNSIADLNQRISMRVSGVGARSAGERVAQLTR